MKRTIATLFAILLLVAGPALADEMVMEQLRLGVPADQREVWLEGERQTWQPWLEQQVGFLGREVYWDPDREEGLLLIRWASRDQWKSISPASVQVVQSRFDTVTNRALGRPDDAGSPFPLQAEGELQPQQLPG